MPALLNIDYAARAKSSLFRSEPTSAMNAVESLTRWLLPTLCLGIAESFQPWSVGGGLRWSQERAGRPRVNARHALPHYITNRPVAWLKFAAQARPPIHRIPDVLRRLRSYADLSPAAALRYEAHRIAQWQASGLPAPRLLAIGEDCLITADAGPTLIRWLAEEVSTACRLNLLERAAQALGYIHGAGFCHGDPLLRHIAYDGRKVTFLNLDEPPPARMPPALAQTRDTLRFLVSATGALPREQLATCLRVLWAAYLRGKPSPRSVQTLRRTLPLLRWFSRLSSLVPSAWLGRDAARALYVFRNTF